MNILQTACDVLDEFVHYGLARQMFHSKDAATYRFPLHRGDEVSTCLSIHLSMSNEELHCTASFLFVQTKVALARPEVPEGIPAKFAKEITSLRRSIDDRIAAASSDYFGSRHNLCDWYLREIDPSFFDFLVEAFNRNDYTWQRVGNLELMREIESLEWDQSSDLRIFPYKVGDWSLPTIQ